MKCALNIVAVALLTVVPYLRPCGHGGFKLFCDCGTDAAVETGEASRAHGQCGHCCRQTKPEPGEKKPRPESPEKKPCKQPLAPELGNGLVVQPDATPSTAPSISQLLVPNRWVPSVPAPIRRVAAPRAPPDPLGLIVVRTQFLLL